MWISDTAIKRPVTTVMIVLVMVIFGVIGFTRLGISFFPDVKIPIVTVNTTWSNATPEQVETDITKILEDAIGEVEGVKHITSQSRRGSSQIVIEFELYRNVENALSDVRDKVLGKVRSLPSDADTPVVTKIDINATPIMWVVVYGNKPLTELREFVEDAVKPRLQQKPGVGQIDISGMGKREVRIWLVKEKLKRHNLTVQDVVQAIQTQNIELPSGLIETETKELLINVKGRITYPSYFKDIIVAYRDLAPIKIGDVAYVEDGAGEIDSVAHYVDSSKVQMPCISSSIIPQSGANLVEVARNVRKDVNEIRKTLPAGVCIDIPIDTSTFTEYALNDIEETLIIGIILTALSILFFLQNIRATIIAAISIPTSLVTTFAFMHFAGFTLNQITMLGLSLAVGIVIDDAIIILENIYRHMEGGKDFLKASREGASEISFAAIAATLSLAAVFVPVAFMGGMVGKFFLEFGLTVAFSIVISLLVALTLIPMLSSRFLKIGVERFFLLRWFENAVDSMRRIYSKILDYSLRHSFIIIFSAIGLFVVTIFLSRMLGTELKPRTDQSQFMVSIETPMDYSLEATYRVEEEVDKILKDTSEVDHFTSTTGTKGGHNFARVLVELKDRKLRNKTQGDVIIELRKKFGSIPDASISVSDFDPIRGAGSSSGLVGGADVQYIVQGPDIEILDKKTEELTSAMREIKGFVDINTDFRITKPEFQINIDRERAADEGVSIADISNTLGATFGGMEVGDYTEKGKTYKIRVKATDFERRSQNDILNTPVRSKSGNLIELSNVADVKSSVGPNVINRTDRERSVTISANLEGKTLGTAIEEIKRVAKNLLPEGFTGRGGGMSEIFKETFSNLYFALFMAIILTYMVLASQFENFLIPFVIILSLPLAIIGALGLLWIMDVLNKTGITNIPGMTINMMFMIGIILLVGLVTKNAILLIDYTRQLQTKNGLSCDEALRIACPTRLRPILMTSVTTIVSTIPILFSLGAGAEIRRPMALAIFGGMITSTLLTLVIIPAIYHVVYLTMNKFSRKLS